MKKLEGSPCSDFAQTCSVTVVVNRVVMLWPQSISALSSAPWTAIQRLQNMWYYCSSLWSHIRFKCLHCTHSPLTHINRNLKDLLCAAAVTVGSKQRMMNIFFLRDKINTDTIRWLRGEHIVMELCVLLWHLIKMAEFQLAKTWTTEESLYRIPLLFSIQVLKQSFFFLIFVPHPQKKKKKAIKLGKMPNPQQAPPPGTDTSHSSGIFTHRIYVKHVHCVFL